MHDAILFVAIINKFIHVSFLGYRFVENAISWLNLFSIISHSLNKLSNTQYIRNLLYQVILRHKYLLNIRYA